MANTTPYEIIAAPFDVYRAPVGTAFPLVSATPSASWKLVGSNGSLNYDEAGITISHGQDFEKFRALGDAGVRKMFRTAEELTLKFKLYDITLAQYAAALNDNPVTTVAAGTGTPGYKKLGMSRGFAVATMALLIRGNITPDGANAAWNMQYEIPIAAQIGNPSVVYNKSTPVGLDLEWMVLVDPSAASADERFGRIITQNATPL